MSDCQYRRANGPEVCLEACAAADVTQTFRYARVEREGDVPAADPRTVDIAVLDMHHGWPNLGHDAIVHAVKEAVCDICEPLAAARLAVRVVSYDVRCGRCVPDPPGGRHEVYLGTGGPGHLDPRRNDGRDPGSQGIDEDPRWEPRVFALFDDIAANEDASLFAVCHTFGVMCRWLGIADAALRPDSKGGKSTGIVDNVLTDEARAHPWFAGFASHLADRRHFPVLDNRLYDLLPTGDLHGVVPLAFDTLAPGGPPGDALTMIEVARFASTLPRMMGVNHHPEIVDRNRNLTILRLKRERGEVTEEWFAERMRTLTQTLGDASGERLLHLTSRYTLLGPTRHALQRALERRAADLNVPLALGDTWAVAPSPADVSGPAGRHGGVAAGPERAAGSADRL